MEIEFYGAAREVTGSCHILRVNGKVVLLDCGMFQGHRRESTEKNKTLPVAIREIDAVVLSHAHIDHSGRLPYLVRKGYSKSIFATSATRDLCAVMLADSAHIQENDAKHLAKNHKEFVEPLYTMRDAVRTQDLMIGIPYNKTFDVVPGVRCTYIDAGHILGSASVLLDITEHGTTRRLVFSGDIGRPGLSIIRDPVVPEGADVVIMESTYGNRDHETVVDARAELAAVVRDTAARGGRVLIPSFAVGRTQELLYNLNGLSREGAIPPIPIYVDSPLATDTTTVFELHPEVFDHTEDLVNKAKNLFQFPQVHFTRSVEESKALNTAQGPMVIIAASGMVEAGRILHHLVQGAGDPKNTILFVGYQAEGTLGRRIEASPPTVRIYGDDIPLRAEVKIIDGYSAHADRAELTAWIDGVKATSPQLSEVFLVHGEADVQDVFKTALTAKGYMVECPEPRAKRTV
ncbi:MAG TPA: MBL fold metallo-hydrolase [Gemmatimonadaceae bacterium]|nr:MBL fold metallo-hydrolase [Gemmatimonadaceae bacterium]